MPCPPVAEEPSLFSRCYFFFPFFPDGKDPFSFFFMIGSVCHE